MKVEHLKEIEPIDFPIEIMSKVTEETNEHDKIKHRTE